MAATAISRRPSSIRWAATTPGPARSAGLEVMAEPKITKLASHCLEKVCRPAAAGERHLSRGPAANASWTPKPIAWWRLDEFAGPHAVDASGHQHDALYEPRSHFSWKGRARIRFCLDGEKNRAAMFVGGRVRSRFEKLTDQYSVSLWLWNGMPNDGRDVSGWFFSRGRDNGLARPAIILASVARGDTRGI